MMKQTETTSLGPGDGHPTDWLEQYRENGYVVLDSIYTESELADIESFFEKFKNEEILEGGRTENSSGYNSVSFDAVDKTKQQVRTLHPHRQSEKIKNYFLHPRVGEVLQVIFGKPALGSQTMYYYKPPGSKGQGMHQDNFYLLTEPAACVGVWTPLDDADKENGCLYIVPGSHKGEILCPETGKKDRWLNYGDSHITKFPQGRKPIPVVVKRGQTLFFHGRTIHGSGPNRTTDRSRRTFIGHYVDEATTTISEFYHPILNFQGETVSTVEVHAGGGPCGDDWMGAVH